MLTYELIMAHVVSPRINKFKRNNEDAGLYTLSSTTATGYKFQFAFAGAEYLVFWHGPNSCEPVGTFTVELENADSGEIEGYCYRPDGTVGRLV